MCVIIYCLHNDYICVHFLLTKQSSMLCSELSMKIILNILFFSLVNCQKSSIIPKSILIPSIVFVYHIKAALYQLQLYTEQQNAFYRKQQKNLWKSLTILESESFIFLSVYIIKDTLNISQFATYQIFLNIPNNT